MKEKVENLIKELEGINSMRSKDMNTGKLKPYRHTALVHEYNNTIYIIKKLRKILNNHEKLEN